MAAEPVTDTVKILQKETTFDQFANIIETYEKNAYPEDWKPQEWANKFIEAYTVYLQSHDIGESIKFFKALHRPKDLDGREGLYPWYKHERVKKPKDFKTAYLEHLDNIYDNFIKPDGPDSINIGMYTRRRITELHDADPTWEKAGGRLPKPNEIFKAANDAVKNLLRRDVFNRFRFESDGYVEWARKYGTQYLEWREQNGRKAREKARKEIEKAKKEKAKAKKEKAKKKKDELVESASSEELERERAEKLQEARELRRERAEYAERFLREEQPFREGKEIHRASPDRLAKLEKVRKEKGLSSSSSSSSKAAAEDSNYFIPHQGLYNNYDYSPNHGLIDDGFGANDNIYYSMMIYIPIIMCIMSLIFCLCGLVLLVINVFINYVFHKEKKQEQIGSYGDEI